MSDAPESAPAPEAVPAPAPAPTPAHAPEAAPAPEVEPEEIGMLTALRRDRFADFSGRATRKEFWLFALFVVAAFAGLFLLFLACADVDAIVAPEDANFRATYDYEARGSILTRIESHTLIKASVATVRVFETAAVLLFLALLVPGLAALTRRFNDVGADARWLLLGMLVPLVGRWLRGDYWWLWWALAGGAWLAWALWHLTWPAPGPRAPRRHRR
ncbi:MAG: DUF805 domain-containing protein [Planctomycetes bacterium]|nr:DUF805 domain-containing protein [Planctomycetota bacterium]